MLLFVLKPFLLFNSWPVIVMTCCLLLVTIGESISVKFYCCPLENVTTKILFFKYNVTLCSFCQSYSSHILLCNILNSD